MLREIVGRIQTGAKAVTGMELDALDLLRSDHMKVEALVVQLRMVHKGKRRRELFSKIRRALQIHMKIEEEIFYPACARVATLKALIDHAHTDHQLVKNVLKDLAVMEPESKGYTELVTIFIKKLEHHVIEEENTVFGEVRKHMSREEFEAMSRAVLEARAIEEAHQTAA